MEINMWFIAQASQVSNPLDDASIMDTLISFLQSIVVASIPFLILAFIVAGLYFIAVRGSSSGIQDARSFLFKLFFVAVGVLGLAYFFTLLLNFIKSLYNAI